MLRSSMWAIYQRAQADGTPSYVARRWEFEGSAEKPTDDCYFCHDLEQLRAEMESRGLVKMMRQDGDHPSIVEVWS